MGLLDIPTRQGRTQDAKVARMSNKKVKKAPATVKSGGGIIDKIANIKNVVETNLGHFKEESILIQDVATLHNYILKAIENGIISIDTETTGLNPLLDKLVGICIYTPNEKTAYIPLNHISYISGELADNQISMGDCKREFEILRDSDIDVIMFNAVFDLRFIKNQLGVILNCTWDCSLASRLLNENEPHKNLKQLHQKYCLNGVGDAFRFDDLFKGITFDKIPMTVGYLYAAHDAIITYELYEFQKPYLALEQDREDLANVAWVFHNIEMPIVNVVMEMEDNGIEFDFNYANELSIKYNAQLQKDLDAFYSLLDDIQGDIDLYKATHPNCKLDDPINIGSSSQIATLLYDILNIEPIDPKQPRGTGVGILTQIDNPICKAILNYRTTSKLISTYIDKLPNCVNPNDGRIHCKFNQYGADTGRFSSNDPKQNWAVA